MAKSRSSRAAKESRIGTNKTILNGAQTSKTKFSKPPMNPSTLLTQATALLHTSQPDEALPLALRALTFLQPPSTVPTPAVLPALNLLAEIYVELGDVDAARENFLKAVELDPEGLSDDGAEKFLWLAQLCEEGGEESVKWFERGAGALRREIEDMEEGKAAALTSEVEDKKKKLAGALCGVVEVYMTDLSYVYSIELS